MKILLAVDELERSREALEWVATLAQETPAEVTVLTVVRPPIAPAPVAVGVAAGPYPGVAVWESPVTHEHVLARAQTYLRDHGIEAEVKLAHGDPEKGVLAEAEAGDYDLLVLGTRGSGLHGTVSSRIAEEAPCPVEIAGRTHLVRVWRRG